MANEQKPGALKVPPLPEAPLESTWKGFQPPALFAPSVPTAPTVPIPAAARELAPTEPLAPAVSSPVHETSADEDLVEELASLEVRLAELENDNIELRLAYQKRGDELGEMRGLLDDSEARVELLESRLAETMEAHQDVLLRQARLEVHQAQNEIRESGGEKLAAAEREIAFAKSLITNLESEVGHKESKLAGLQSEMAALRTIVRNVDPRAIEMAKRRMGG